MVLNGKVLLLDYDGVVLRNNVANNIIAKRAGLYTKNVMSMQNKYTVDTKASCDLSFNLYKGFGHTLLGINAVGINHHSISLRLYNSFVYSHIDYEELQLTNNDMNDVQRVVELCQSKHINVFMFSNSPKYWINQTMGRKRNLKKDIPDIRDVLNVRDDDATMLKPHAPIYDLINDMFKDKQVIFVDDSSCNFQYTLNKENWINVLYCGLDCNPSNNMYMINDLDKLQGIIEQ